MDENWWMSTPNMNSWGTPNLGVTNNNWTNLGYQSGGLESNPGLSGMAGNGSYTMNNSVPYADFASKVNSWTDANSQIRGQDVGTQQPVAGVGQELPWYKNFSNWGTIAQGIGALSSAYLGMKNYKLAKEQLGLSKEAFNANLNNSIKTYNTSLEDRIRGRTAAYDNKENDVQAYLAKHSLKR